MEKRIDEANRELSELTEAELAAVSGGVAMEDILVTSLVIAVGGGTGSGSGSGNASWDLTKNKAC